MQLDGFKIICIIQTRKLCFLVLLERSTVLTQDRDGRDGRDDRDDRDEGRSLGVDGGP